ncbi:transmembrane protein 254-like isoform X2 [Stylophora pistillata]|uniref:transmembrane protein 254-like isoform X2 n=1 Tax=Stylophora pistillata TaxID=50429 RepID=UPI000C03E034|nr:transmembrane protein 254-like isoform X2 [Stylophora pistillata]
MAPPRVTTRKDNSKDNPALYEGDFFQLSSLPISIIIIFLMIFYWFVCYNVDVVPLHAMGPAGTFVSYLAKHHLKFLRLGFRFAVIAHLLEAGFAYRICSLHL